MHATAVIRFLTNTRLRAGLQRRYGAARLRELGGPLPGPRALEVGCGRGLGVEQIRDVFAPAAVDAFDFDPAMVALAERRLAGVPGVRLWRGDATRIDAPDATYDAAFEFVVLHHVPRWRDALAEIFRVLRPGGRFYAEEILTGAFVPAIVAHRSGYVADAFTDGTFRAALLETGFEIVASRTAFGVLGWYTARKPG